MTRTYEEVVANLSLTDEPSEEELRLKDGIGGTVAHRLAGAGYRFSLDSPALFLEDDRKVSVAHLMAFNGAKIPHSHPAASLVTKQGIVVADIITSLEKVRGKKV